MAVPSLIARSSCGCCVPQSRSANLLLRIKYDVPEISNSCHRNHSRYTLCTFHFNEGHEGDWKDCPKCRKELETEMYVWYGTNEYNFEKLENLPSYEPTKCAGCGRVIRLADGGYSYGAGGYRCQRCTDTESFGGKAPAKKRRKK